jgi:amidase
MDATELAFAGIARQAELVAAGEVSSRELVELYLGRIERLDPQLNAFRVVFAEKALLEADQADARRRAARAQEDGEGAARRPLLGVPFAVKDNIDVAGDLTTQGTRAQETPAAADAEIVRRLRVAGAVVIGRTNMPELGAFPWTETPTWGLTRNPWNLEHTPGGSSGGSGAAVAAGLVGAALGSDGGGSIRYPAAYCGLFGLKGQRGRLPLSPHTDAGKGLSVNGVLTRSVYDTALSYQVLADGPADVGAPAIPPSSFLDAVQGASASAASAGAHAPRSLGVLSIGVCTNLPPSPLTQLHSDNESAVQETAELLRTLGHRVEECELEHGHLTPPNEFAVRFLAGLHEAAQQLDHPERMERRMRTMARLGGLLDPMVVRWARGRESQYAQRINEPFVDHDMLLMPVTPAPPPRIGYVEGRGWVWTSIAAMATVPYAAPWNVTGQPAAAVPAGFGSGGLPRAVQLVGRPNDEATVMALAAEIEAARPWAQSRPPGFA